MNELIKQFAQEAGFKVDWQHEDVQAIKMERFEKFAELIVAECSKVIRHGGQRKGAFGNEDLRPSEIATMIEEHFGVKS